MKQTAYNLCGGLYIFVIIQLYHAIKQSILANIEGSNIIAACCRVQASNQALNKPQTKFYYGHPRFCIRYDVVKVV